ncbi:hypothetical protein ACTXIV_13115 [Psychrobacter celer]|uniref:hypothetical protein n=1 Tax=Psychrobacter celer TaxID=306572 RepID=UPI003FD0E22F
MPNWCRNVITIDGDKAAVTAVKSLIINQAGEIDFAVLLPIPAALNGIYADECLDTFTLDRSIESRLGKLTPADFYEKAQACFKATGDSVFYIDDFETLISNSPYLTQDLPVEDSIEQAVRTGDNQIECDNGIKISEVLSNSFIKAVLAVMEADREAYCKQEYGFGDAYHWTQYKWGSTHNASMIEQTHNDQGSDKDYASFTFHTANHPAKSWFMDVIEQVKQQGTDNVLIDYAWASDAMGFGGDICRLRYGEIVSSEFDDETIQEFLSQ